MAASLVAAVLVFTGAGGCGDELAPGERLTQECRRGCEKEKVCFPTVSDTSVQTCRNACAFLDSDNVCPNAAAVADLIFACNDRDCTTAVSCLSESLTECMP